MYNILLLGCGFRKNLDIGWKDRPENYNLTTLDYNSETNPDIYFNLDDIDLPFTNNKFDEIHAYEVLEHTGTQGDVRFFFNQWNEFYRILKPNGVFFGSVPRPGSDWIWGDPGHRRHIHPFQLEYLDKDFYAHFGQTSKSDYQSLINCNFKIIESFIKGDKFYFGLKAV